jgi:hypothetical protein
MISGVGVDDGVGVGEASDLPPQQEKRATATTKKPNFESNFIPEGQFTDNCWLLPKTPLYFPSQSVSNSCASL